MEEFDDGDERHYVVSRLIAGFTHSHFRSGAEVTHWSGVTIDQAVAINADREAGSNEAARHVRGLDNTTVRPMSMALPPAEGWVVIGYRRNGTDREIRLPWRVFQPDSTNGGDAPGAGMEFASAVGLDLKMELTNRARKAPFAKAAVDRSQAPADLKSKGKTQEKAGRLHGRQQLLSQCL